ncbi:hypothetical protein DERP_005229 [Dermatophagoides pteronyssinus]|uniref:Uncharacterized protein n=1 Tax=Dermatophagoides pteronyssinus TaxID=6956 RepID=A0ABQ8JM05_DERPT|nr:hypothetical protein DERP_005229 [Dermatophagoides pteronyssinus]
MKNEKQPNKQENKKNNRGFNSRRKKNESPLCNVCDITTLNKSNRIPVIIPAHVEFISFKQSISYDCVLHGGESDKVQQMYYDYGK